MKITYEFVYYGDAVVRNPPTLLRKNAERAVAFLHGERSHEMWANEAGHGLLFGPQKTNPAWKVTFTP